MEGLPKHCGPIGADRCKYCGRRETDYDVVRCVDTKAAYERSVVRIDSPPEVGTTVGGLKMDTPSRIAERIARLDDFIAAAPKLDGENHD